MKIRQSYVLRFVVLLSLTISFTMLSSRSKADTGTCGGALITVPFTDVSGNIFFCQIAAAYFSGLTSGTTPTTYSPGQTVTRDQMAAFITRTMDQSLKRGSRRAVAKKWWAPQTANDLTLTPVTDPQQVAFDGTDLWVSSFNTNSVSRIRPSDGKLLETWTSAFGANGIIAVMGKIFVTGRTSPGSLYMIDPTLTPGPVTSLSSSLGNNPQGIAFDGLKIWTANQGGSVSIVSLSPIAVTNVSTGFSIPIGILHDGADIWVTDIGGNSLLKLNSSGVITQTIIVGNAPRFTVCDGTNIWVPNSLSDSVSVVRVKDAAGAPLTTAFVLTTLTGNGLNVPFSAAFDGERILVTNSNVSGSVSLWKATELTPSGSIPTGNSTFPVGACSDGLNFWMALQGSGNLARF